MNDNDPNPDLCFEVSTPLGFCVRVTHAYWDVIVNIKHPVMTGREVDVKNTLAQPDEIRRSRSDAQVYLFYRAEPLGRWVCAVSKQVDETYGFLITADPTDAVNEGVTVWHK